MVVEVLAVNDTVREAKGTKTASADILTAEDGDINTHPCATLHLMYAS